LPHILITSLWVFLLTSTVQAQEVRYVSDNLFVTLRSADSNDSLVIHHGLPSGTRLTVNRVSEDQEWSEVVTEDGTIGWVRSQYLMADLPARALVDETVARVEQLAAENSELTKELAELRAVRVELGGNPDGTLQSLTEELAQLRQISGRSLQMDADNRRLVEEAENLRVQADMLGAENQRLQENLRSSAFLDGALAVLLGVVITLVAPRLWPKRRRNDGWG
jgi:SH3 domain protein